MMAFLNAYKLVLYLCHHCHQCNRSCVWNSVVTQSTPVIFSFPTNDLLSYKILSEICLLCWRHFCASRMKWKYLMVLFNCKTINICYANSRVGTVMCHCYPQPVAGFGFTDRAWGSLCPLCSHMVCEQHHSDRRHSQNVLYWTQNCIHQWRSKKQGQRKNYHQDWEEHRQKMYLLHSAKNNWGW